MQVHVNVLYVFLRDEQNKTQVKSFLNNIRCEPVQLCLSCVSCGAVTVFQMAIIFKRQGKYKAMATRLSSEIKRPHPV